MSLSPEPVAPAPAPGPGPVALDLLRRAATVAAAATRVRERLDPEAVHDLRVAARRLEAALRLWAPAAPGAKRAAQAARRQARRLRRAAGDARELEVHVALLESRVLPEAVTERSALLPVLASLRGRRDRERAAVAALATPRRIERIADGAATVATALASRTGVPDAVDDGVRRVRRAAMSALEAAVGTGRDDRLHAARVAVKKWRYAEESRAAAGPPEAPAPLEQLRGAQKSLGAIHDHAVLRDLLRRRARRAERSGEPAHWASLAAIVMRLEDARHRLLKGLPKRLRALADAVPR